jgi:hypothetical protein
MAIRRTSTKKEQNSPAEQSGELNIPIDDSELYYQNQFNDKDDMKSIKDFMSKAKKLPKNEDVIVDKVMSASFVNRYGEPTQMVAMRGVDKNGESLWVSIESSMTDDLDNKNVNVIVGPFNAQRSINPGMMTGKSTNEVFVTGISKDAEDKIKSASKSNAEYLADLGSQSNAMTDKNKHIYETILHKISTNSGTQLMSEILKSQGKEVADSLFYSGESLMKDLVVSTRSLATGSAEIYRADSRYSANDSKVLRAIEAEEGHASLSPMHEDMVFLLSLKNKLPQPIAVFGPAGWGKTHFAQTIGKDKRLFDHYHEVQVQPGMEARDLIGGISAYVDDKGQQKFSVVDGPVAAAFRSAQKGRTMLLIDEANNLDRKTWTMFKGALNRQVDANGEMSYELQTQKPLSDGSGYEVIRAPAKNLAFIFTGNIGHGYEFTANDDAVQSRFRSFTYGPTKDTARDYIRDNNNPEAKAVVEHARDIIGSVTEAQARSSGFNVEILKRNMLFVFDKTLTMAGNSMIGGILNPRQVSRSIENASTEKDVYKHLAHQLLSGSVNRRSDGYPFPEQVVNMNELIKEFSNF